jgi:hypothetical protein
MAITVALLLTGCSTAIDGRGAVSPTTSGRTIAQPSADGQVTRPAEPTTTSTRTRTPTSSGTTGTPTGSVPSTPAAPTTAAPTPDAPDSSVPATATPPGPVVPDVLSGPVDLGPNADGYLVFQAPSGNIFCNLAIFDGTSHVRCDLINFDYPDIPPTPCENGDHHAGTASLDGNGVGVVGGCVSDTVIDTSAVVLPYGSRAGVGDVVCHAAEDGVTCGNLVTGHGFQVARTTHRVF